MNLKLDELTKEELQKIIEKIAKRLSKEQYEYLQHLITECTEKENTADISPQSLMSKAFVDEKMLQIEEWKQQIEDGKLYLDTEEYEDYGEDYWDREWIIEYYDNQQIGDKIMFMIRFANDCINDRRYQEANSIYEWLWEMEVGTDYEDGEFVDLDTLAENGIIATDMKQLALQTLYANYQVLKKEKGQRCFICISIILLLKPAYGRDIPCWKGSAEGSETILGGLDRSSEKQTG